MLRLENIRFILICFKNNKLNLTNNFYAFYILTYFMVNFINYKTD